MLCFLGFLLDVHNFSLALLWLDMYQVECFLCEYIPHQVKMNIDPELVVTTLWSWPKGKVLNQAIH